MNSARALREYRLFRFIRGATAITPLFILQMMGSAIGIVFFLIHKRRRIVLSNLLRVYPERSFAWRLALGIRCGIHYGRSTFDLLKLSSMPKEKLMPLLTIEGLEHLIEALKGGKGAFVLSGHFGNWEMAAHAMALRGVPQDFVYRPLDNPHLDREMKEMRTRFGSGMIPKKGAVRGMIKALRENHAIDIVIDQHVPPDMGVTVPFMGQPTPTNSSLAMLALKNGAPVIPLFSYPRGRGYHTILHPPVQAQPEDDAASLTEKFNDLLTEAVTNDPHLWLWFHDRWGIDKRGGKSGEDEELETIS